MTKRRAASKRRMLPPIVARVCVLAALAHAAMAAGENQQQQQPNYYGDDGSAVLHSWDEPKVRLYDTRHNTIATYEDAREFCRQQQGRVLASQLEWCLDWIHQPDRSEENVLGGHVRETEQWAPVRAATVVDRVEWLQIGHLANANASLTTTTTTAGQSNNNKESMDNVCRTYQDLIGTTADTTDDSILTLANGAEDGTTQIHTIAGRIATGCSGQTGKPSLWQQVEGEGLIWDPFCGNSEPLNPANKPLGGMTGGCPNHKWHVDDKRYCMEPRQNGRALTEKGHPPPWLSSSDQPTTNNDIPEVACTRLARAPAVPQTCASVWGASHFITFDSHRKHDCEGSGEYVATTSLDSPLQLQVRMERFNSSIQATVVTAAVLRTGHPEEPTVEIAYNDCRMTYMINRTYQNLDLLWVRNGTMATGTEDVVFFVKRDDRFFHFRKSGLSFHIRKKHSDKMGCYFNIKLCIPDKLKESERLIGMWGTPDGISTNEVMDPAGGAVKRPMAHFAGAYRYCTQNWCIRHAKESLFAQPYYNAWHCTEPHDSTLESMVMAAPPELYAICEGDVPCLIEGTAGDLSDSTDSVSEQRLLGQAEMPPIEEANDPDSMEQDDIFETTDVKGAPPLTTAYTKGDPHFLTWSGERFDYQGECDLVLLHNPSFSAGRGMDIHARTRIETWWSYVEAAALRIGSECIEVVGGDKEQWIWFNRKTPNKPLVDEQWYQGQIAGYKVRYRQVGSSREVNVHLGRLEVVSLKAYKDFVRVDLDLRERRHYEGAIGLLGQYPGGERVARDRITPISDVNLYGQEWQVQRKEPQLFHSYQGKVRAPQKCMLPTATQDARLRGRRLEESSVNEGEAKQVCGHLDNADDHKACIADVLATGDVNMALEFD
ncbi:expressed unknown protein [Seminavis robusta]|uniref:VWFD domain-containing protein n=1 Tax=Seminavis robusta TaxID=568900 RepID=A0A9N8EGX8_9STRA|nr:expressed unknown protein [Seminavis robusta]|eukprot:Sro978_g227100.1 n/a (885) ;mRNA; f:9671-12633